jgi:anti-sigma regulatory factor (Ser/Thr protein kinase)
VAVARRAGLVEQLEELRLAVGEACARAVRRCNSTNCDEPVTMFVDDTGPRLVIVVTDAAKAEPGTEPGAQLGAEPGAQPGAEPGAEPAEEPEPVVLSLLEGLADYVEVRTHQGISGAQVHLEWWPTPPR